MRTNTAVNFFDNIKYTETCWLWTGKLHKGYGRFSINMRTVRAHRFSYEFFHKEISDDMIIMHSCDVRNCVNPNHLFEVTNQINSTDMSNKGRQFTPSGEDNHLSKLTLAEVKEIRDSYIPYSKGDFSQKDLAKKYKVDQSAISYIVNNKTWKVVI